MSLQLADYVFNLPPELIAQRPPARRDEARMMVLRPDSKQIEHRGFSELKQFLTEDDLLVLNNTRVMHARRFSDDGKVEFLFLRRLEGLKWRCLVKPGRKMRLGALTRIEGVSVRVEEVLPEGERIVSVERELDLQEGGSVPLPPYMDRPADADDDRRYQTVFAESPGAVAAPTAGLHFTPEMLQALPHAFITLHVGPGTFRPVFTENIAEHRMHEEQYAISAVAANAINQATRVLAVGTTTVRVLESARRVEGRLVEQEASTDIFIYPPQKIRHVDRLLTNFHLPRSTLLMLVSAFVGREFLLMAYAEAIRERYRFYSYGDCMLIL